MFSSVSNNEDELPDVSNFIDAINDASKAGSFFDPARTIFLTRAPGRLDLMGGIADYSGSLVLQYPICEATLVALQRASDSLIRIESLLPSGQKKTLSFEISLDKLKTGAELSGYAEARKFFDRSGPNHWAAYVVGVFLVLMRERGVDFSKGGGARIFISSNVPEGKGVSSSAALEVAMMQAVNAAFDLKLDPRRELALLCQKAENEVVGAPCGVMDQMVSACGEKNKLLALLCQPAELQGTIKLPPEIEVWGIDSGIRHSVAGADYGSVRSGAFMGYRIIAELAGLGVEKLKNNLVRIRDEKWGGYLANISPLEFEENFKAKLPETIKGSEFLEKYHGTTDKISVISPEREYPVLAPTAHPIYENSRVKEFARLLEEKINDARLQNLGSLMNQSHESYSACGLGSEGTDLLVELVKKSGAEGGGSGGGLYGAKITGGGSGGTVAILGARGAGDSVKTVAENYLKATGLRPLIFSGSSPGAAKFGFRRFKA